MAGTSQIGCTLDSLSAKLLSLPILCAVLRHPPLPERMPGEPHELDAQDSCLSPSSLVMFKLLPSSFFPLLLPTARPCPGLQHYCNSLLAGFSASALFSPSCSVFLEQYVHCLSPHLRAFPITSRRVMSKLCLLFRTLRRPGQTSQPGILTAVKPIFSLPPQPGTQPGSPHPSLPSRGFSSQECSPTSNSFHSTTSCGKPSSSNSYCPLPQELAPNCFLCVILCFHRAYYCLWDRGYTILRLWG